MSALDWLKNNWNKPAQGIAAVTVAVLSFAQPPADGVAVDRQAVLNLVRVFLIPVVWLIMSIPARRYSRQQDMWKWFVVSIVLLVISLGFFGVWLHLRGSWIKDCVVPGEPEAKQFVIGETFRHNTIAGYQNIERIKGHVISEAEALEALKNAPVCTLIVQDHGQADLVWEPNEIDHRRALITYFYIAGVPFFVLAMMGALQGWYCAGRPPSP